MLITGFGLGIAPGVRRQWHSPARQQPSSLSAFSSSHTALLIADQEPSVVIPEVSRTAARTTLHNGHANRCTPPPAPMPPPAPPPPPPPAPPPVAPAPTWRKLGTATNHPRRRSSPADQCQAATDERGPQAGHPARYRCTRRAQGRLALVSGESARSGRSPNPAAHLAARDHAGRPQARRRRAPHVWCESAASTPPTPEVSIVGEPLYLFVT